MGQSEIGIGSTREALRVLRTSDQSIHENSTKMQVSKSA